MFSLKTLDWFCPRNDKDYFNKSGSSMQGKMKLNYTTVLIRNKSFNYYTILMNSVCSANFSFENLLLVIVTA